MKKTITTLLVLFCFTMSFSQDLKTFTDKESTFTIDYPDTWKAKEDEFGKNRMISFESPKKDEKERRGDAMVALTTQPLEKGVTTLDALMKSQLGSLKKEMGVKTFVENKRVNGKQILVFNMQGGNKVLKTKMVIWVNKGFMYSFMYAAESKNYAAYLKNADAIIDSFKFL